LKTRAVGFAKKKNEKKNTITITIIIVVIHVIINKFVENILNIKKKK
jgi:hypothetical protein